MTTKHNDPVLDAPFDGPGGWIQFKGSDICMDWACPCGFDGHVDGDFVYSVKCGGCGKVWALNGNVKLVPAPDDTYAKNAYLDTGDDINSLAGMTDAEIEAYQATADAEVVASNSRGLAAVRALAHEVRRLRAELEKKP